MKLPLYESEPTSLDDTQPIHSQRIDALQDTQPVKPMHTRLLRILAIVIGLALVSVAVVLTFSGGDGQSTPVRITLIDGGNPRSLTASAQTVADLLREQDIDINAGDTVTPGLITRIENGMQVEIERARTVTIIVDELTTVLRTTLDTPDNILRNAGIIANTSDRILIDGTRAELTDLVTWPVPVTTIMIERAVNITILDGDSTISLATTEETVGDALEEAGITLFLADSVTPDVSTLLGDGLQINVDRSRPLTIIADGRRQETRTNRPTIGDAVTEAGIVLTGLDYTVPAEEEPVVGGISVRVIRVTEELLTEQETLPFETVYQPDENLTLDNRQVLQSGLNGVLERTIRVRYENGIEVRREVDSETVVQALQTQIVAYGTQIVIRTLDTPDGPVEYWRHLSVYATSYHPAALGGDNITATGRVLQYGVVATDPRIIPYYTRVYVPNYGVGEILDTGGPRSSPYWIDLGYSDDDFQGWSRMWEVYLLTPVPETVNYLLPSASRGGVIP
ncbi:MAG: ubiquitin-like domain-containing protein [Aggregatilineales bacterium]